MRGVNFQQVINHDVFILLNYLQVRAFSCLFGKAREMEYAIPDDKAWPTEGKFEGATVLDAKKGAYFTPIAALDFAS
jgi:DNA polymerase delta subunit 1